MTISISKAQAFTLAESMEFIKATEKEISHAYHVSIGRAANLAKKRVIHEIAKRLDIPLKVIKRRLFLYKQNIKGVYKLWAGLNDFPLEKLGKPKKQGMDILVKGITASNAYITKGGQVRLRESKERARLAINDKAESLLNQLLPFYFYQYFDKEFKQLLKFKYGN